MSMCDAWARRTMDLSCVAVQCQRLCPPPYVCLSHVAALGVVQDRAAQRDPRAGRKEADRNRLVALQRHHEHLPVLAHLAAHKQDVLDVEAAPDQALERLLLLRMRRLGNAGERSRGYQRPDHGSSSMTNPVWGAGD